MSLRDYIAVAAAVLRGGVLTPKQRADLVAASQTSSPATIRGFDPDRFELACAGPHGRRPRGGAVNEESKSDRLARVLAASLTEQNGRPTKVVIQDDFAYIEQGIDPDTGATVVHKFVVPPEAYDALAVSEEHGGQGFGINLLSPLGERAWPNEGSNP